MRGYGHVPVGTVRKEIQQFRCTKRAHIPVRILSWGVVVDCNGWNTILGIEIIFLIVV